VFLLLVLQARCTSRHERLRFSQFDCRLSPFQ
jgi:hypothetical protein